MPILKKCSKCNIYMKRGPVMAEKNGRIVVLSKFKLFECMKCGDNEVVDIKLSRKK